MLWTNIEELSPVHREFGTDQRLNTAEAPMEGCLNHIDLFHRLNARDCNPSEAGGPAEGNKVAGGRAYFLRGVGCYLNQVGCVGWFLCVVVLVGWMVRLCWWVWSVLVGCFGLVG